ncbi:MAG TPA: hypothetical protein VF581_00215 [Flavobacterium sp.]|jgi:hypothetical protein
MKKIIAVLTFMLAFTVSANAQDQKAELETAAKRDAAELTQYLSLSDEQLTQFVPLFKKKHQVMQDKTVSAERKQEMSRIVGLKINASLDGNQQEKLAANPELWKRLTE